MKVSFSFFILVLLSVLVSPVSADDIIVEKQPCLCADGAALHPADDILACYNDPRCESLKLDFTIALRVKGRSVADAIKSYLELTNNAGLSSNDRQIYLQKISDDRKRLIAIKKTIPFNGYDMLIEPLYLDFDALDKRYYRHYNSFNIGYEYISLNKIFQKGVPRIGVLHYRRFGPSPSIDEGLGNYGVHIFGSMQLTSSVDQANADSNSDIQNTLVVSASVFIPFFRSMINYDGSLSDLTGVLISYGAKKNSSLEKVSSRLYTGFRNSFNPETYIDVLFGSTQSINSSRIEVNAHLPVYKFEQGSRLFFGGSLNMSNPWTKQNDDPDIIRFYLEWNADFGKIFEGIKSTFGV